MCEGGEGGGWKMWLGVCGDNRSLVCGDVCISEQSDLYMDGGLGNTVLPPSPLPRGPHVCFFQTDADWGQ